MNNHLYKIVIVEDEEPVRKAISEVIDWEKHGFELVFQANDGQEALDFIQDMQPDVLFTDICMPIMDGLELTKKVMEINRSIKVVILTGYSEFEYAKQAINLNVNKYILKPITAAELTGILVELKTELDDEIREKRSLNHYKKQYEESRKILEEKAFLNLLDSNRKEYITIEYFARLGIDLDAENYIVSVLVAENIDEIVKSQWDNDFQLLDFAICNVVREILNQYKQGIVFIGPDGQLIIIFKDTGPMVNRFNDYCIDIINQVMFNIKRIFHLEISVGVGDIYSSIEMISYSYMDALSALEYKLLVGNGKIIVRSDIESKGKPAAKKIDEIIKKLKHYIKISDIKKVGKQVDFLFEFIKSSKITIAEFKTILLKLNVSIMEVSNDLTDDNSWKLFELFSEVFNKENIDKIKEYYLNLCNNLLNIAIEYRKNNQIDLIKSAVKYIYDNFRNSELDVQMISEYLHLSTSYFSRLFKRSTGETFVEYLTRVRMDKSKELLKTSAMKITEISEYIGYNDPHYFSYNFRKQTGVSPSEYRKG